jgi:alpha-tubulin suppressor-like RCC1 family protein
MCANMLQAGRCSCVFLRSALVAVMMALVAGAADAQTLAGGDEHSIVLKSDGTVWTFGENGSGQLGINSTTDSKVPVQVSGLTGIIKVAAGADHAMALTSTGNLYVWG